MMPQYMPQWSCVERRELHISSQFCNTLQTHRPSIGETFDAKTSVAVTRFCIISVVPTCPYHSDAQERHLCSALILRGAQCFSEWASW